MSVLWLVACAEDASESLRFGLSADPVTLDPRFATDAASTRINRLIYERLVDFVDQVQPSMLGRVKLFQQDSGLFERFAIEDEIEAALKTKVWLKSGGHIVIHPTEALVAIDVNTGRYVGRLNLEDTVLTTNLEAVSEIVRTTPKGTPRSAHTWATAAPSISTASTPGISALNRSV